MKGKKREKDSVKVLIHHHDSFTVETKLSFWNYIFRKNLISLSQRKVVHLNCRGRMFTWVKLLSSFRYWSGKLFDTAVRQLDFYFRREQVETRLRETEINFTHKTTRFEDVSKFSIKVVPLSPKGWRNSYSEGPSLCWHMELSGSVLPKAGRHSSTWQWI